MKSFLALAFVASALASPYPAPQSGSQGDCADTHDGKFQITAVNVTKQSKRRLDTRQLNGPLTITLSKGVLTDQAGRTGYIASNYQFQFDAPPQAGTIKASGFSYCSNNSLALDGSAIFYQCLSGDFWNLYDRHWAEHCSQVYLVGMPVGGGEPPASQVPDGQPQVSAQGTGVPKVTQIPDGQPQVNSQAQPITQIPDGQPQVPHPAVTQIPDGQPQVPPAGKPVTQIPDGQPQVPQGKPVTQISDGQPQVPATPAPQGPPVTQISDGQPQVPAATAKPVTPQGKPVTQIPDGQPQVPAGTGSPAPPAPSGNYTVPNPPAPTFTGGAEQHAVGVGAMAVGLAGLFALL